MLVSLLIIYILEQLLLRHSILACDINPDYVRGVSSAFHIQLCLDAACSTPQLTLKESTTYSHCIVRNDTHSIIIKVVSILHDNPIKTVSCLILAGWINKDPDYPCTSFKMLKFISKPTIKFDEIYVVGCGIYEQEFPNEKNIRKHLNVTMVNGIRGNVAKLKGYTKLFFVDWYNFNREYAQFNHAHRLQIVGFDGMGHYPNLTSLLFFPTQVIVCVANCKPTVPSWSKITNPAIAKAVGNNLIIKTDISKNEDLSKHVVATCSSGSLESRDLKFYIAETIEGKIASFTEGKKRNPLHNYDAGEKVSCQVNGSNSVSSNITGAPPVVFINLVDLDQSGYIIHIRSSLNVTVYQIPENLISKPSGSLGLICYFGVYKSTVSDSFHLVLKVKIFIGGLYYTKLQFVNSDKEINVYDFLPGAVIKCNTSYYVTATGAPVPVIPIYILYGILYAYPKSQMANYNDTKFDNATSGVLIFTKKYSNYRMFAFCLVNDRLTTPAIIYSGDRPEVKFVPVHPLWITEYQLEGFTIDCNGTNIDDIILICLDCLPDTRMDIQKVDQLRIRMIIPKTLKKNVDVTYQCKGVTSKHEIIREQIKLKVIVSEISNIDTSKVVQLYNLDSLTCRSSFTVIKNQSAVTESIIIPVQMQVNKGPIINENGELMEIPLRQGNDTIIGPKQLVNFLGCCPTYINKQYTCLNKWKTVQVTRNYYVKFNLDLNEVYPGNVLKCYLCVNYTTDIKPMPCSGVNLVHSKITMIVRNPDGLFNRTGWQDEVRAPIEGLRPDKSGFYKISDYVVKVGCKERNETKMLIIPMKSCSLNPPSISINPKDKSMFLVGDIITCTTESLSCKSGLTYVLYIQRGSEPIEPKTLHSLTLTKKHIGNNIKITCTAGEGETARDERLIRVEVGPHNVSITVLHHIMMYRKYLRCNVVAFPPATITWTQIEGPSQLTVSEYFLLIGPWDFSGNYVVQCEARNERGSVTKTAKFKIFNPRIVTSDYSGTFYFCVPLLTFFYVVFSVLSLALIFQENIFSVPFFSEGNKDSKAKPPKSKPKSKETDTLSPPKSTDEDKALQSN